VDAGAALGHVGVDLEAIEVDQEHLVAPGELSDEIIGTNRTGCPNLRVTIRLKKPATS